MSEIAAEEGRVYQKGKGWRFLEAELTERRRGALLPKESKDRLLGKAKFDRGDEEKR